MKLLYPKTLLESWILLSHQLSKKSGGKPKLEGIGDDTDEIEFGNGFLNNDSASYLGDGDEDSTEAYDLEEPGQVDIPGIPYEDEDEDETPVKKGRKAKTAETSDFKLTDNQKIMIASARAAIYRKVYMIGLSVYDSWNKAAEQAPDNADLKEALEFFKASLGDKSESIHTAQDLVWIMEQVGIFGHDAEIVAEGIPDNLITSEIISALCYLGLSDSAVLSKLRNDTILDFDKGAVQKLAERASRHVAGKEGGIPVIHPYSENALIKRLEPNYKSSVLSRGTVAASTQQSTKADGSTKAKLGEQTVKHIGTSDVMDPVTTKGGGEFVAVVPHIIVSNIEDNYNSGIASAKPKAAAVKMKALLDRQHDIKDLASEFALLGFSGFSDKYKFKPATSGIDKSLQSAAYITGLQSMDTTKKVTMSTVCAKLLEKELAPLMTNKDAVLKKNGRNAGKGVIAQVLKDIKEQAKPGGQFEIVSAALCDLIRGQYTWFNPKTKTNEPFFDICTRTMGSKSFSELSDGDDDDDKKGGGVGETVGSDTAAQDMNMENTDSGNDSIAMADAVFDNILAGAGDAESKSGLSELLRAGLLDPNVPTVDDGPEAKLKYAISSLKRISSAFSRVGCFSKVEFPNGFNMQVSVDPGDPKGETRDIVRVWTETIKQLAAGKFNGPGANSDIGRQLASISPTRFASAMKPFIELLESYSGGVSATESDLVVNLTTDTYFGLVRRKLIPNFNLARIVATLALNGYVSKGISDAGVSAADVRAFVNKALVYLIRNHNLSSLSFPKFVDDIKTEFDNDGDYVVQYASGGAPDWTSYFIWLGARFLSATVDESNPARLIYPDDPENYDDSNILFYYKDSELRDWYENTFLKYGLPEDRILSKLAIMYMHDSGSDLFVNDFVPLETMYSVIGDSLAHNVIGGVTSPEAITVIEKVVSANEPFDEEADRDLLAAIPDAIKTISDSGLGDFPSLQNGV